MIASSQVETAKPNGLESYDHLFCILTTLLYLGKSTVNEELEEPMPKQLQVQAQYRCQTLKQRE